MATTKKPTAKKPATKKTTKKPAAKPVAPVITSQLRSGIDRLFAQFSYASIMSVTRARQLLAEVGLGMIQLHEEWKVTKDFIKSVERGGGWCSIDIGTPIIDGRGILSLVMKLFEVTNPESGRYGGHGTAYYSDLAALQRKLNEGTIKVLVARTGAPVAAEYIELTLEAQQALVGGNIEAMHIDGYLYMFCDEDGYTKGKVPNFAQRDPRTGIHLLELSGKSKTPIVGDVFFCRVVGGECQSVEDTDIETVRIVVGR